MKIILNTYRNAEHGFAVKVTTCNAKVATTVNAQTGEVVKFSRSKFEWMIEKGVFVEVSEAEIVAPSVAAAETVAIEVAAEIIETIEQGGLDAGGKEKSRAVNIDVYGCITETAEHLCKKYKIAAAVKDVTRKAEEILTERGLYCAIKNY